MINNENIYNKPPEQIEQERAIKYKNTHKNKGIIEKYENSYFPKNLTGNQRKNITQKLDNGSPDNFSIGWTGLD